MSEQKSVGVKFLIEVFNSLPKANDMPYNRNKVMVPLPDEISLEVSDAPTKPVLMRHLTFEFNYENGEWEMLLDA